jgi:hypothetical protein
MSMNLQEIVEYANKTFDAISSATQITEDVVNLVNTTKERLEAMANANRGPTQEERDAQDEVIRDLRDKLHSDDH